MTANARGYRLTNIDMLRGLVIVIMAIDHVRDYVMVAAEQDPMANPDIGAALFFTRWITHFCAPVFVFLAGTSAGLMTARKNRSALGAFLFKRGMWLIVVGVGLPGVYAVWLLVIATLYPLCKWVAAVKGRRQDWWLSYL